MHNNSNQWVAKYYQMNPDLDEFLWNGRELAEGMVVMVADPENRADPNMIRQPGEEVTHPLGLGTITITEEHNEPLIDALNVQNRWSTVKKIEIVEASEENHQHAHVDFLAEYADGTLRKRRYHVDAPWLRRDSMIGTPGLEVPDFIEDQPEG